MDKKITAGFGVAIFLLFVAGLAETIGEIPFTIIVVFVCAMALYGVYEEFNSDEDAEDHE